MGAVQHYFTTKDEMLRFALAYANLTDFVIRQLNDALPGADAGQAARHLVSVIEGLRWPVLFGVYSEQQAMDVLDAQLDLIFGSVRLRQSRTTGVATKRLSPANGTPPVPAIPSSGRCLRALARSP
jgi:hypothetical protein